MATNVSAETIKATRLAGGKRMAGVRQGLDRAKAYAVEEAVEAGQVQGQGQVR